MRDNEFEKGVQEKMGEFRLPPSAPVWVEVERRIRERKRRRILIFWFCLAGLLTAGLGSWWIFQNGNKPVMVLTTAGVKQSDTTIPGKETIEPNSVVSAPEKNNTGTTKPQSENTEAQTNLNAEVTLKSSREIEKKFKENLKQHDIDTLSDKKWLNDNVINGYIKILLEEKYPSSK